MILDAETAEELLLKVQNSQGHEDAIAIIAKYLKKAHDEGFQEGHDDGYNDGYSDGESTGYDEGYEAGKEEGSAA